jgi:uroporphyrinogen-III decarboxylase
MKPRDIFLRSLRRQPTPRVAVGSATSIVTTDLMDDAGAAFPEAHLNPEEMALMGGISNIGTLRNGTLDSVEKDVRENVRAGIDILGPECAVPLDAPFANLQEITRAARRVMPCDASIGRRSLVDRSDPDL